MFWKYAYEGLEGVIGHNESVVSVPVHVLEKVDRIAGVERKIHDNDGFQHVGREIRVKGGISLSSLVTTHRNRFQVLLEGNVRDESNLLLVADG